MLLKERSPEVPLVLAPYYVQSAPALRHFKKNNQMLASRHQLFFLGFIFKSPDTVSNNVVGL